MAATGGSGITTAVTVTTTASVICTNNPLRRFVLITNNDGATTVYVAFGTSAATTGMIPIPPAGNLILGPKPIVTSQQNDLPTGVISAIAASGSVQASITEF